MHGYPVALSKRSDPSTKDIKNLIERLKNIDVARVEEDEDVKGEALALARKITSTLEGPINRATDLMFRVCATSAFRILLATYKISSLTFRLQRALPWT
jgi:hypothetical protein